ncbi:MAG: T9SS type A sorting domain-containing protein, partial [candidate division KSB1 bacterium]|nr:T9SS type A sorting domain-containing protein [candidate division KSB1 bacterium]
QNYPNPFRDYTTIGYDLHQSTVTRLEVYDIMGRLVCTLVQGMQLKRKYRNVRWSGTDAQGRPVASGIYFVKLTSGEFSQIKKMVLVR